MFRFKSLLCVGYKFRQLLKVMKTITLLTSYEQNNHGEYLHLLLLELNWTVQHLAKRSKFQKPRDNVKTFGPNRGFKKQTPQTMISNGPWCDSVWKIREVDRAAAGREWLDCARFFSRYPARSLVFWAWPNWPCKIKRSLTGDLLDRHSQFLVRLARILIYTLRAVSPRTSLSVGRSSLAIPPSLSFSLRRSFGLTVANSRQECPTCLRRWSTWK